MLPDLVKHDFITGSVLWPNYTGKMQKQDAGSGLAEAFGVEREIWEKLQI